MLKKENIFSGPLSPERFRELALHTFHFQYGHNPVYRQWVDLLNVQPRQVSQLEQIPFLPIEFFKSREVLSTPAHQASVRFTSSATTSQIPALHVVNDVSWYEASFLKSFELFYGSPSGYCVLALLPNYLQRGGSSLVYMCDRLIRESQHAYSGFFLDAMDDLAEKIRELNRSGQKTLLMGVSYALMDLCDRGLTLNDNVIVMETGGMKGRRKEMLKPELHAYLKKGFHTGRIHSEYGMTELLSQAYSRGGSEFESPPWLRFLVREVSDPLHLCRNGKTGGINVIDLANQHSCAFIATKDLGRMTAHGTLELMGRYDNSDIRGCNLLLGEF